MTSSRTGQRGLRYSTHFLAYYTSAFFSSFFTSALTLCPPLILNASGGEIPTLAKTKTDSLIRTKLSPNIVLNLNTQIYGSGNDETIGFDNDDNDAKSQFGTKEYWDEQYQGRGDFPMDEYQWYYGFDRYGKFLQSYAPTKDEEIMIPGIGNDPILLDLLQKGYKRLTATDYSEFAIDRQQDLLFHQGYSFSTDLEEERKSIEQPDGQPDGYDENNGDNQEQRPTKLLQMDARMMPKHWAQKFDTILEKGTLDAIYLSGDGNVELAAKEFGRTLKPGGVLISISCVVPVELREEVFRKWTWIRDGRDDLDAGCFIFRRPKLPDMHDD